MAKRGRPRKGEERSVSDSASWVKIVAARAQGKRVQAFMTAWVLECRMLDEYHAMIESMYGEGGKPRKHFEATSVMLEVIESWEIA